VYERDYDPAFDYATLLDRPLPPGQDYSYEQLCADELFTRGEADQLSEYLRQTYDTDVDIAEVSVPINAGYFPISALPVGGNDDIYMLSQRDDYCLPFKACGYYAIDERCTLNPAERHEHDDSLTNLYYAEALAEIVLCKWRNLSLNLSIDAHRLSIDGHPLTTINKINGQADSYVLALVDEDNVDFPGYASDDELLDASNSHREIWPSEALAFLSVNDLADRYGEDHVAAMIDELPHLTGEQIRAIFEEQT